MTVKVLVQFDIPYIPKTGVGGRTVPQILEEQMALTAAVVMKSFNEHWGSPVISDVGARLEEMPEDEPCKPRSHH